jgi:hypothetical protein
MTQSKMHPFGQAIARVHYGLWLPFGAIRTTYGVASGLLPGSGDRKKREGLLVSVGG